MVYRVVAGLTLVGIEIIACADPPTRSFGADPSVDAGDGGGGAPGSGAGGAVDGGKDAANDVEPDVAPPDTCKTEATECTAAAPAGWMGPLAIYDGNPANAPACPGETLSEFLEGAGHDFPPIPPAQCAACSCQVPQASISCGASTVTGHGDLPCSGCDTGPISLSAGDCLDSLACGGYYILSLTGTPPKASGTCSASAPAPTLPPVTWGTATVACKAPSSALQQVDCSSGEVCAPKPPAPFQPSLCVAQMGDVSCPGAPYATKQLAYLGMTDQRACTACSCAVTEGTCSANLLIYNSDNGCSGPAGSTSLDQSCILLGATDQYDHYGLSTTAPLSLQCTTGGGAATGTITAASPVTICCE